MSIHFFYQDTEIINFNGVYHLREYTEYIVKCSEGNLLKSDFIDVGKYISSHFGLLKIKNKSGLIYFKGVPLKVESKIGDQAHHQIVKYINDFLSQLLVKKYSNVALPTSISKNSKKNQYMALLRFLKMDSEGKIMNAFHYVIKNPVVSFCLERRFVKYKPTNYINPQDLCNVALKQMLEPEGSECGLVYGTHKNLTADGPENRFIKFFLLFLVEIIDFNSKELSNTFNGRPKPTHIIALEDKMRNYKRHIFSMLYEEPIKSLGQLYRTPENSLKLQNLNGYRDLYQLYMLMLKDLGDIYDDTHLLDVRRNDDLYELFCFIFLARTFDPDIDVSSVISPVSDNLNLYKISAGKALEIKSSDDLGIVKLYYQKQYGHDESFSQNYCPDFSMTVERGGKKFTLLFDAKFKSHQYGEVKKEDIDKMHTYCHAIKDAVSAIVLYPGQKESILECDYETKNYIGYLPCLLEKFDFSHLKIREHIKKIIDF